GEGRGTARAEIASAMAREGAPPTPKVGQHYLAALAGLHRQSTHRIDHLGYVFRLQYMETRWVLWAFDADRADLCQAAVIKDPGAPGGFDALPRTGNTAARLAGDD